ncbi:ATP-binding protein [Longitalea arenae]|uniref:ATP-binding protein n=1 Tax=Longitalea arenae TaxID=2812558 RepID=UPI001967F4CA|nr:ATP-binding protein [Longitalea arenae]
MKRQIKPNRLIFYSIAFSVAFIAAGIILQFNTERIISKSRSASREAIESFHLHNKLQNIVKNVILTESLVRGFVITGDSNFIAGVEDTLYLLKQELAGLQQASMNQYNQASFTRLASLIEKRIQINNEIIDVYTRFGKSEAEKRISSKAGIILRDSITDLSMQLEKELYEQLQAGIVQNRKRTVIVLAISRLLTILGLSGIVILSLLIIRHIMRQHQLIKKLKQAHDNETEARQQAIESANVKEQFLANMSHEIRTPINSVIGFTNLLQKSRLTEEQQQFVNLIQSASENLLAIINDILDISKIEAGMLRIEKNPFSLRGLCSSIETMFYHKAREKNLSFSIYIQENIPDTLNGDAVRLTQIMVNLISNAIKFTQKGGISINITSLAQNDDQVQLRFSVKDSGIGIPASKVETIFERFQQGETDTTRKYGGTGLGLSIVKNLVQIQGGQIRVLSEPGKGTEFIFDIGYSLVTMGEAIPATVAERTEISAGAFPDARVLVVEDNAMNQLLIKFTFQSWKVNYELADNGTKAIEWLQRATFHLVLLDIQMPLMDGYATAQAIRKDLKSDIPIIAMTAHALAGEREKCLSYGMNDYISKPIHEKELYSLLTKYLADDRNTNIEMLKNELHYIDLNFLQDMVMGNTDFLKTIIKQFLKQFPGEMEALKNAIDQRDARQVATLSHHIQSTVSILGKNTPFFQQLEKLEKLAKKNSSPTVLSTEFDKLNDYKQLLIQEVNQLLNARVF